MAKYNLTPNQRETFAAWEQMSAAAGDPTWRFAAGPGFEGVRGVGGVLAISRMDVKRFEELKLIDVMRPGSGGTICQITQAGHDAVANDFEIPVQSPSIAGGVVVMGNARGNIQGSMGDGNTLNMGGANELIGRMAELLAELVSSLREYLPADEVEASERDAEAITVEMKSENPDGGKIIRRLKAIGGRISAGLDWTKETMGRVDAIAATAMRWASAIGTAYLFLKQRGH